MGLDMYLDVVRKETGRSRCFGDWNGDRPIFNWFETELKSVKATNGRILNCADYPVTKKELMRLRKDCERVISIFNSKNGKLTEEDVGSLKPSFSHTFNADDIHEGYRFILEQTIEIVNRVEYLDLKKNKIFFTAEW